MAHALTAWGVGKGERVAVLMANASEFLEIFFACAKTGAIMVPVNFRLAVPELAYIFRDCAPRVLVYSADFASKVGEVKASWPGMPRCFRHGGAAGDDPLLVEAVAPFPVAEPLPREEVTLADPLFIMYTSGTTGDPKGAVLTHGNVLFGSINTVIGCGINRSYKSLVVAPLFHIGALGASALPVLYAGGSLVGTSAAWAASPDDYPNRPVQLIVPFPPGGSTDMVARIVVQKFSEKLGQNVL